MRGTLGTGLGLLAGALVLAVVIVFALYRWDAGARAEEATLRPQPVAPLAAASAGPALPLESSPQPVAIPTNGDPAAGAQVFQAQCNGCHPNANAGIGPALHGPAFSERFPTDGSVAAVVRAGRGGMPAFSADKVSDQDLANLVAYLRTLSAPSASPAVAAAPAPTAASNPAVPAPSPSPAAAASPAAPPSLSASQLTAMEPGLSSFMMETAKRMGRSWFAGQASNWDEAAFEIREAREVLQHGAVRQNASRQQAISSFNTGFMDPLVEAAQGGDKTRYEAAYRSAIQGCNSCHASQTYGAINQPFSFIRVQVPTKSIWDVYAYAP